MVVFQKEFKGTVLPPFTTAQLQHNITSEGNIRPRYSEGDTTVQDGFVVLAKCLNAEAGGRMKINWLDDDTLEVEDIGGVGLHYEVHVRYRTTPTR
jgi:hypothetical protein